MTLLRLSAFVLFAFAFVGCEVLPTKDAAKAGPFYTPANVKAGTFLPSEIRRVIVLPVSGGPTIDEETLLKLDGVVLFSNARGIYLGDARFRPLFEELERRSAVVFVHPTASPDAAARSLGLPDSLIDFTADTTRAVAQLHYGNTFARTPNVKYIFSHAGGTIPYLATRFSIVDEMNVIPGAEERGTAADTLRRLYWDTALSWRPPVLHMLRSVVGMGLVLFGSDYPYLRRDLAVRCRREVETSTELDSKERRAVLSDNALKLFPRLATRGRTET